MHRTALLALIATLSFAQTAPKAEPKPPAAVDAALRARVKEFYQYHVTEEYRKAEKLVAPESQDLFYIHNKPHYLNFEIKTITYSDKFTKAKVSALCEQYFHGPGFEGKPMKAPSTSTWKLVHGKWFWYVDPEELARGPFGKSANAGTKATAPLEPPKIPTTYDFVLGKVKFDRPSLVLNPGETKEVTITSKAEGPMTLSLEQKLPEIEVSVDKSVLNTGEKAVVTLKAGENPHAGLISFRVDPVGEVISIEIKRK